MECDLSSQLCLFCILALLSFDISHSVQMLSSQRNTVQLSDGVCLLSQQSYPRDCQEVRKIQPAGKFSGDRNNSGVFFIKPDGYNEPFEVFCDTNSWMIIHRRFDTLINFNRSWEEYKNGFGFLDSDFWLGNEKLSHITHQKTYQLLLEFQDNEGWSYQVTYGKFRVGDEYGNFSLLNDRIYNGNVGNVIQLCPKNQVYDDPSKPLTRERSCDDPHNCLSRSNRRRCVCPKNFILRGQQCLPRSVGESACNYAVAHVSSNGSTNIKILSCVSKLNCTADNNSKFDDDCYNRSGANCEEGENGIHTCRCITDSTGDGVNCIHIGPRDCHDLYHIAGEKSNGRYRVYPTNWSESGFEVYCQMSTDGGGWTVFQRRINGTVNFTRGWDNYTLGFGNLEGNHWLGNDKLHILTNQRNYSLWIDLQNDRGEKYHAIYSSIRIAGETDQYRLQLGSRSGTATHDSMSGSVGKKFSTYDRDNDDTEFNCAKKHLGGWWYHSLDDNAVHCSKFIQGSKYFRCSKSNLNGDLNFSDYRGIFWNDLPQNTCNVTQTMMKIRPIPCTD